MNTVVVWVLLIWIGGRGPVVVDNIASEQNCRGLAASLTARSDGGPVAYFACSPVRKVVTHG